MNKISQYALTVTIILAILIRLLSIDFDRLDRHVITNYDGLGYYVYLPAIFIYNDITHYKWIDKIDEEYKVIGDSWKFQFAKLENGNHVVKYLGGVAILQAPFFLTAHVYASMTDYPADGFSIPYQLCLSFATLFYFILAIFLLRKILLRYYEDKVVAITLFLLFLASNAIEYISIEAGQCHGYILFMYTLMIWLSLRWHDKPNKKIAAGIGLVIGLTTIMRPTELIIFLIPLLWNTHTRVAARAKWTQVKAHKNHLVFLALFVLVGALPQLIYWMYVTGNPIYVIGSKWYFLDPYFRVLIGWQKGWFIYTPVTIFFVLGLLFMKGRPFQKSVIWFCVLNIWIVISWSVWRYGGSYSTRALVQSYPVFALALAGFVAWIVDSKFKIPFYILAVYLTIVNLFQIWQYRQGILRHDEMNRAYYQAVYLDSDPEPLDMSLLDDGQQMSIECNQTVFYKNLVPKAEVAAGRPFFQADISRSEWLDITLDVRSTKGFWRGYIVAKEKDESGEIVHSRKYRMFHYLTKHNKINRYHIQLKPKEGSKIVELQLGGGKNIEARIHGMVVKGCSE